MKVKHKISPVIISTAFDLLKQFVPDLTPVNLIDALEAYNVNDKPEEPLKPLYTVKEACKLLKISKPTIYRMFRDGELTRIKAGNSARIPAAEIDRLLLGK